MRALSHPVQRRSSWTLTVGLALALGLVATLFVTTPAEAARTSTSIQLARDGGAEVVSGATVRLTGKAPKALRGRSLAVEYRAPGSARWVRVGATKVSSSQRFATRVRTKAVGTAQWRVRSAALGRTRTTFVSRPASAKVFGWFHLTDQKSADDSGLIERIATMVGTAYPSSLISGVYSDDGFSEYNLNRRCKQLRVEIGLDDRTPSGSAASFTTSVDGREAAHGTHQPGTVTTVMRATTRAYRVRLAYTKLDGEPTAAFGNPRVLCDRRP